MCLRAHTKARASHVSLPMLAYVYLQSYIYIYIYIYMRILTYKCMHVDRYATCGHIYIYIYIYIVHPRCTFLPLAFRYVCWRRITEYAAQSTSIQVMWNSLCLCTTYRHRCNAILVFLFFLVCFLICLFNRIGDFASLLHPAIGRNFISAELPDGRRIGADELLTEECNILRINTQRAAE